MPRFKLTDSPEHLAFVLKHVAADLADADLGETKDRIVLRGLAALKKYHPSSDTVYLMADLSGFDVEKLASMLVSLKGFQPLHDALQGQWRWERAEREARVQRVYFVHSGGLIKTGCSFDVPKRIKSLQTNATTEHRLIGSIPGGFKLERDWHTRFAHLRSHREWFHATGELLTAIDEALATVPGAERSDYAWSPPVPASA